MKSAILLSSIWLIIIPIIIGLGIIKIFKQKEKSIFLSLIIGIFIEFTVFQLLAIPFTVLKLSFYALRNTWLIIILIFTISSIILNFKNIKDICKENIDEVKKFPKILTCIFIILLLFQCYMGFKYKHEDADDSNFVAKAVIARDTNSLFKYNDEGEEISTIPWRNGLSPFPWFTANIATLSNIHPTILAHSIFPIFFVIIAYDLYFLIGKYLFESDYKKVFTFLIILCILYIFGNYTRYSIFVRLLTRIWQGKSILSTISIPFIFYIFLKGIGEKEENFYYFLLLITLWGSVLVSSMALSLPIIISGLLTLIYMIKDRKIRYLFKYMGCLIPSICYGIIYLLIK